MTKNAQKVRAARDGSERGEPTPKTRKGWRMGVESRGHPAKRRGHPAKPPMLRGLVGFHLILAWWSGRTPYDPPSWRSEEHTEHLSATFPALNWAGVCVHPTRKISNETKN